MVDWLKLAKQMVALGFDEIHQSDLSTGRKCRKKLYFYLQAGRHQQGSMPALLGSIFHRMVHTCYENNLFEERAMSMEAEICWEAIEHVFLRHPPSFMWEGQRVTQFHVFPILIQRVQGLSLINLVFKVLEAIRLEGMIIEAQELPVKVGPLVGEIDLVVRCAGERGVLDLKSYGMWQAWTKGKSIKKVGWEVEEVELNPQLRHYSFLYERSTGHHVDFYGFIAPANTTTYVKGARKGQVRGETLFTANALPLDGYEEDVYEWLLSFLESQPRDYPANFGKSECPNCQFRGPCLKGATYQVAEEYDDE